MNTPKLPALMREFLEEARNLLAQLDAIENACEAEASAAIQAQGVPDGWREFLQRVAVQKPEKPDYWSACGQCERNSSDAEDLLASAPPAPQAKRCEWTNCPTRVGDKCCNEQAGVVHQEPVAHINSNGVVHAAGYLWGPTEILRPLVYGDTHHVRQAKPPEWHAIWIRNNYQDYPNIQSLCDALIAAANATMEE